MTAKHSPDEVEWLCDKKVPELVNDIMYAMLEAKPNDIHLHLAKWAVHRLDTAQLNELQRAMAFAPAQGASSRQLQKSSQLMNGGDPFGRGSFANLPPSKYTSKNPIRAIAQNVQPSPPKTPNRLMMRNRSQSFVDATNKLPDFEQATLDWYYAYAQRPMFWHNLERYIRMQDPSARDTLQVLEAFEMFHSYPGPGKMEELQGYIDDFARRRTEALELVSEVVDTLSRPPRLNEKREFDVLVVGGDDLNSEIWFSEMVETQDPNAEVSFGLVLVSTFAEALTALLMNGSIQAVIVVDEVIPTDKIDSHICEHICAYSYLVDRPRERARQGKPHEVVTHLIAAIKAIRTEIDVYLVSERPLYDSDLSENVRRVFFARDDFYGELSAALLGQIEKRAHTPFFTALQTYAARPIGVFHAMAISRGSSLLKSNWLNNFMNFYGMNIFRAESSATCGGLDSLLDPTGSIKNAQKRAAEAYGSQYTYFVTNGTSTANKIVLQTLLAPNDIVLLDRDCHKSHHYGIIMTGALPAYLDAYPLHEYAMYGAVSLRDIKKKLFEYKRCGKLHKVKLIVLTNCTFDGIVYNVQGVMEQCLAIKPDLCFLWDEAWYAYASFHPILKRRTGMGAANRLLANMQTDFFKDASKEFWRSYGDLMESNDAAAHEQLLDVRLYPKPKEAVLRVYVTQSTHKSLTAFRQGSMIHVFDQIFQGGTKTSFKEAYYTHTSTSPNYQILASLDVGRAQMQLEGFEFTMDMLGHAMYLRHHIGGAKHLQKWIRFLDVCDLIPAEFRKAHGKNYFNNDTKQVHRFEDAWLSEDEFVLDPTRLTLYTGQTGINGNDFKVHWLMNKCDIQVNKTSRNSVLFQTNIGTTFSSTTFLIQSLSKCMYQFQKEHIASGGHLSSVWRAAVDGLTKNHALLPDFTEFHASFRPKDTLGNEGSIRDAFYLAFDESNCEFFSVAQARKKVEVDGEVLTGTTFIIPYPPGFPIIMPGQIISVDILDYMQKLDVTEIHGYNPVQGLRVFKQEVLANYKSF